MIAALCKLNKYEYEIKIIMNGLFHSIWVNIVNMGIKRTDLITQIDPTLWTYFDGKKILRKMQKKTRDKNFSYVFFFENLKCPADHCSFLDRKF